MVAERVVVGRAHAAGDDDLGVEIAVGDLAQLEQLGAFGGDVVDGELAGAAEVLVDLVAGDGGERDLHRAPPSVVGDRCDAGG